MKFRVHELSELLVFLNMDSSGIKAIQQERLLDFFKKEIKNNFLLSDSLEKKIEELNELCKIPIKKRGFQYIGPLYDTQIFPMFSELRQLVYGQKFRMENGKQTVQFELTPHLIHKIFSGKRDDGSFRFEIQLNVWNFRSSEEWNDIYLNVEVNKMPIDVLHPSPHLIYLTSSCIMEQFARNTVTVSSPRPETLKDFAFCICVVKRWHPKEILQTNSVQEVCNTASLISELMDGQVDRTYKMGLTCPVTKEVMKNPCRSTFCTHPEVFDLITFLNDMQYYQQWKCPICMKIMQYENIVMDMYLKKHLEDGKYRFVFYKRRVEHMLTDNNEEDIEFDKEVIHVHD